MAQVITGQTLTIDEVMTWKQDEYFMMLTLVDCVIHYTLPFNFYRTWAKMVFKNCTFIGSGQIPYGLLNVSYENCTMPCSAIMHESISFSIVKCVVDLDTPTRPVAFRNCKVTRSIEGHIGDALQLNDHVGEIGDVGLGFKYTRISGNPTGIAKVNKFSDEGIKSGLEFTVIATDAQCEENFKYKVECNCFIFVDDRMDWKHVNRHVNAKSLRLANGIFEINEKPIRRYEKIWLNETRLCGDYVAEFIQSADALSVRDEARELTDYIVDLKCFESDEIRERQLRRLMTRVSDYIEIRHVPREVAAEMYTQAAETKKPKILRLGHDDTLGYEKYKISRLKKGDEIVVSHHTINWMNIVRDVQPGAIDMPVYLRYYNKCFLGSLGFPFSLNKITFASHDGISFFYSQLLVIYPLALKLGDVFYELYVMLFGIQDPSNKLVYMDQATINRDGIHLF